MFRTDTAHDIDIDNDNDVHLMGSAIAFLLSSSFYIAHVMEDEKDYISPRTTTRKELWSYYLYYIGNNGLSGFNFGPSQFQNLLFLAGYDPTAPPFSVPCGINGCVLPYLGRVRDSEFILLISRISWYVENIIQICSKFHCPPY